ncbi:MAG: esterase [Comamonas sp. SCN 65-56]|uniref:YqiA/YcfP family alpha/beta fold hydrolase n=1 Tax=Comamonas sp. SCN 65-56 TaxID=1660095 RepID=UPI00086ACCC2|nr:YqiA/YcfP family alpha/beta fold hydrolase [Comamonas sp. SCN 65-56]ODS93854.1 MAG: esterase [Comamonas sp. SCN 65-56]
MPATTHLLYLHGFRSSPQSAKAQLLQHHVSEHDPQVLFAAPQLPPSPKQAAALLLQTTHAWDDVPRDRMAVIGSSLGGFYATWLAQQLACKSVLINPSIAPWVTLQRYLGVLSPWDKPNETFDFRPEHLDELEALDVAHQPPAAPQLLIVATGDEVLDWRDTVRRYPQATTLVHEGGDHGLPNFADYLPEIEKFLHWRPRHE